MKNPVEKELGSGRKLTLICALAATLLSFTGCSVGPQYKTPTVSIPTSYKELDGWTTAEPNDHNFGGNWWEIFQDQQLNNLEQEIDVSNQNLKQALAQYQQARAALRSSRADYYPTLSIDPTVNGQRYSDNRPPPGSFDGVTFSDFTVPVNLSYETDAFGRVSKNVESYREQAQASAADVAVVSLTMHAELAIDYFAARALDTEEKLLQDTVTQYQSALQLNEDRYAGGLASEVEVEQARTILETTQAQAVDVGVARAQFEHAVAVLVGKPPAEFTLPPLPLTAPPPRIPVGMPSQLLERRPDIAAAERQVASANSQIGLAKLAYYPIIDLAAGGGFDSGSITTLFSGPSAIWAVGGAAAMTLLDGGRRRAVTDEAKAGYDSTVASYRETVLSAFQQVEDNLVALRILEQEAGVQDQAVQAAQRSLDLSINRYDGGVTSYLEVTVAQSAALSDEVTAVNILGRRMASAVQLIQALGGAWNRSELPNRPESSGKLSSSN